MVKSKTLGEREEMRQALKTALKYAVSRHDMIRNILTHEQGGIDAGIQADGLRNAQPPVG
jgi:hypothetical protein